MSKNRVDISDNTAVSMPVRNMIAIIVADGVGVWSYFGITEKLNQHSTTLTLMQSDLEKSKEGIRNLKFTYAEDTMFCCHLESIIQRIDSKYKK